MAKTKLRALVSALVASPQMQDLWQIKDRGVPVFVHTVDVTLLCLDRFPEWQEKFPYLGLDAITIGSLLHDLSKLSTRQGRAISHSYLMSTSPAEAVCEAMNLLREVQFTAAISLAPEELDHIWHIIASHHGRWGKVPPSTPEALLVHEMDYYSATHHRCSPVDANDALPLLDQGHKCATVAARLGVGTSLVRTRLSEACRAERVRDWGELVRIWRGRGYVLTGSLERMEQIEQVRNLMKLASEAPKPILDALTRIPTRAS